MRKWSQCFLAVPALIFLLSSALEVHAAVPRFENVTDLKGATQFARSYADHVSALRQTQPDVGTPENPVVIEHFGEAVPETVQWIAVQLHAKNITVVLHELTPKELEGTLERRASQAEKLVTDLTQVGVQRETLPTRAQLRSVFGRMREGLAYFLGLPDFRVHGVTYFLEKYRTMNEGDRAADTRLGMQSALVAATSITVSSVVACIKNATAIDINPILHMAVALGVWVHLNVAHMRAVGEFMSQGKKLVRTVTPEGVRWSFQATQTFVLAANWLREFATGVILSFMANVTTLANPAYYGVLATNASIAILARVRMDKFFFDRTPNTKNAAGEIVPQPGQFSVKSAGRLRTIWENAFGLATNLNFVGGAPNENLALHAPFWALMALNVSWIVYDNALPTLKSIVSQWSRGANEAPSGCTTLFSVKLGSVL